MTSPEEEEGGLNHSSNWLLVLVSISLGRLWDTCTRRQVCVFTVF